MHPIVKAILSYSNYQQAPFANRISGSGYGSSPRVHHLWKRHWQDVPPEDIKKKVPLVVGTAMHFLLEFADLDKFLEEDNSPYRVFDREKSMHFHTPSGITLTGTYDLVLENKETGRLCVGDMKTMRSKIGKNFLDYQKQLTIYAWIGSRFYNREFEPEGMIIWFDKTSQEFGVKMVPLDLEIDPIAYTDSIVKYETVPDKDLPFCTDEETDHGRKCRWCGIAKWCNQLSPFEPTGFTTT